MKRTSKMHLVLWVLFIVSAIPVTAYAVDGQIKIAQTPSTTFPIWINVPGSYVLTSNIVISSNTSAGIIINTDDVTLDLNGHSIIGPGGDFGKGIYAHDRNNIVIMNGTVQSFGGDGIELAPGTYPSGTMNQIKNIYAYNNGETGIAVWGSPLIINCTAVNNSSGIQTYEAANIINCTASSNVNNGISVSASSITDSVANNNGSNGFYCSNNCAITNSTAKGNVIGFKASSSTLTNCAAYQNSSYGFDIKRSVANNCEVNKCGFRAERSTITNCTANECDLDGIYAISETTIFNFTAISNGSHGIHVEDRCRIEGCNLRQNGWGGLGYGIYMSGSHNYAIKNVASDNASGNFYSVNPANNYMPTSLTSLDAANANIGW